MHHVGGMKRERDDDDEGHSSEEELGGFQPHGDGARAGKKTKGRVKIKMEFIDNKLRRYTTFSKRKTGIMKKAYELSTLTGTQVMLLVASETGHVYTFATRKLQPMITSEAGKALIQTCLNSPDPPGDDNAAGPPKDYRMSATGYEETDLSYHVPDDEDYEREENGEEEDEESVRKPTESDARAFREESMRDLREDGCREVREQSASPPRDEEGNVRLQVGQHHVAENRGSAPDDERGGGAVPPVMTIPPHVLSQILSSPGFSLQGRNMILPGHSPPIPVSLPAPPPSSHLQTSDPTSPLNLERKPKHRSPTSQADNTPHNLSLPKR